VTPQHGLQHHFSVKVITMAKRNISSSIGESILAGECLLPVRAVAQRFGMKDRTIREWVKKGKLPAVRPDEEHGPLRFRLEDIVAFENKNHG
jgi:excisionase family DNA binding protein